MIRSLWTAATGMTAQQTNIDVIANNLANVSTNGFKKGRTDFQDLMYQTLRTPGMATTQSTEVPSGIQIGLGTRLASVTKVFTSGEIKSTENALDVAIQGEGFYQITRPDGTTGYTRDGSFKLDSQGRIVNSDGYPLDPEITIDPETTAVSIGADGTVSITKSGSTTSEEVGQIKIAKFANPAGLISAGGNLYVKSDASGEPVVDTPGQNGLGTLAQYTLEMSNVQVVDEMVNMITAQRAYEVNSKAIQTADDMLSIANNLKR